MWITIKIMRCHAFLGVFLEWNTFFSAYFILWSLWPSDIVLISFVGSAKLQLTILRVSKVLWLIMVLLTSWVSFLYLRPGYREIISHKRHESAFSGEDAWFGFLFLHGTYDRPARKPVRKWKGFVYGSGLAGQCLLQTVPARYIGIIELNVSVEDEVHSLMMDG